MINHDRSIPLNIRFGQSHTNIPTFPMANYDYAKATVCERYFVVWGYGGILVIFINRSCAHCC